MLLKEITKTFLRLEEMLEKHMVTVQAEVALAAVSVCFQITLIVH